MTQKWAGLAALTATALAVGACGGSGPDQPQPDEGSELSGAIADWADAIKEEHGGTSITVAAQTHPSTDAMQKMTAQFEELTDIDVTWDVVDQNSLKQKIELDFQSGNSTYDVVMVDSFWMSGFTDKGIIDEIDDRLSDASAIFDYDDLLPAYRDGIDKYDGTAYGVAVSGESRFLGYRTDLFEEHDKTPPETMDEFLELAEYFNEIEPGLYGVAMRAQKGIHFTSGLMTLMYQFTEGFFDPETGENQITSDDNLKALEYYLDLLSYAPNDVGSYTHEEALSAFMSGHAAMWFDATAIAPSILDPEQSVIVDDVGFVGPPAGDRGTFGALAGWSLSLAGNSQHKDAGWAFIEYMTSKDMALEYVRDGGVPTRTSILENPETDEQVLYYPAMLEALDAAANLVDEGIAWLPEVSNSDEKLTIIGNYGSEALAGSITAEQALERASAEVDAVD